jgi:hypothetical protein
MWIVNSSLFCQIFLVTVSVGQRFNSADFFKRELKSCDGNSKTSPEPLLSITDECQLLNSFEAYSLTSSKKINFKKPLNGRITVQFPNGPNVHVSVSDRLKLKKCIQIKAELFEDVTEVTGHFVNNILQNQATISLSNGTIILVKLNSAGHVIGFQKHFDKHGLQVLSHWNEGPAVWNKTVTNLFVFSQKINSKHFSTFDFDTFFLCPLLSQNAAWNCSDVEMSQLDLIDGFPQPTTDQLEIQQVSFNIDAEAKIKKIMTNGKFFKTVCKASNNLRSWIGSLEDDKNNFLFYDVEVT